MNRHRLPVSLVVLLAFLLLGAASSCGSREEIPADPAGDFKAAYEKYRMMDDRAVKADMMDEFVMKYPDSELTGRAVGLVVYNRYLVNDDYSGALGYLDESLSRVTIPAVRKAINLQKLEVLAGLAEPDELTVLAEALLDLPGGLSGGEKQQVLTAATDAEAWPLAESVSDMLLADLSDSEDKFALSSVRAKKALVLHNLERNEEALELFEEAAAEAPVNFAGYFEYPVMDLEYRWAHTLQAAGNPEMALEVFEKRALFVKEETPELQGRHQAFLKELYSEAGHDAAEFEDYKAERKNALTRQVPEFSAPDSTGEMQAFSEIRGEKATLLVFWFPT